MSVELQTITVIVLVAICVAFIAWQGIRTFIGKRSKLGSCCTRGCGTTEPAKSSSADRVAFLPAEMLRKRG